jgi:8-oxo-dGTP diphosphatase
MDVTCAIIIQDKKVLLARRAHGSDRAGLWEFPGGKLHLNETLHQCIIREISEELNVVIHIHAEGPNVLHVYTDKTIRLFPFICSIIKGVPEPLVHAELTWVSFVELPNLDLCQADKEIVKWFLLNMYQANS